jgi:hypothetical protein
MRKYPFLPPLALLVMLVAVVFAKNKTQQTLVVQWPNDDKPTLKLTFGTFQQIGAYAGQLSFVSEVTVENMSGKSIPRASFTVYLLNKDKVRIGDGVLRISDLRPGEQAKIAFQFNSVGIPTSLTLNARNDASGVPSSLKTVSLRVISTPPGANLKVDGKDAGVTPLMVNLTVGTHNLEFRKEGYANGNTPVEVTQDELPGGSITFELGGLSRDTIELRDGTIVLGDAISVSLTTVVVRVDGKDQTFSRNQVKKIMLVERELIQQAPATQPAPLQPQQ